MPNRYPSRRNPLTRDLSTDWPHAVFDALKEAGVWQMSYVPDAGHATLIERFTGDPQMTVNVLTTEEEGIAIAAGSWLGGVAQRAADAVVGRRQLHQHAVAPGASRMPLLMLVTMRGEWGEFNPWQVPMGRATAPALEAIGVTVQRVETRADAAGCVAAAATMAFDADQQSPCCWRSGFWARKSGERDDRRTDDSIAARR